METKDRKTFLIAAVVVCLAFWLGDSLIVEPLISSWKARDARLVALRLQVAKGDQLLKRKAYYENRWRQMKANTLPLNISQAESQMITAFDRWQRESGVKLERIAPQWKNDEEFTALEYRADVTGSLDSLTKFLYSVEKVRRR